MRYILIPKRTISKRPAQAVTARINSLRPKIKNIMSSNAIKDPYSINVFLFSKPGYLGGDVPKLIFYIEFREAKVPGSWGNVRDNLVCLMMQYRVVSVQVELVDREQAFMPSIFPLPSSARSIKVYESIREHLLRILQRRIAGI